MISGPVSYADILTAVENGIFVVFAAGTIQGEPTLAWQQVALVTGSPAYRVAHDDRDMVRAGQALGAICAVGAGARPHGFTPA